MESDEKLYLSFRDGSRQSFDELFGRYVNPIYCFFRRRLHDEARAEELAQETWMAVLRGTERYEPRALFRTYLYAIALKVLAGEHRRQARQLASAPEFSLSDTAFLDQNPDTENWVRQALNRLDELDRQVIMLREYEQLSYAEIATLLHIPVNTVRSRLFRARLALKAFLEPDSKPITVQRRP